MQNWQNFLEGLGALSISELRLHTDVDFVAEALNFGPYSFLNALARYGRWPLCRGAVVLLSRSGGNNIMKLRYAAALLSTLWAQVAVAQELHLICGGSGSANKISTSRASVSGSVNADINVMEHRRVGFEDQVNIDIVGSAGRIRVPRTMLPPIHGGDNGWFELKNLKTTDQEITASATINFMNSPKIRLDRSTGHILIDGKAGNFSGNCEPYDPTTVRKKF